VPSDVIDLGNLATMPMLLAAFFGLLGCATVAHALVTTVRRRRYDLAVLRAMGFTRPQARGDAHPPGTDAADGVARATW
jgi:hypothetical protein